MPSAPGSVGDKRFCALVVPIGKTYPNMRYRAIPPSPYLAKYIECFWTLESDDKLSTASPERILPDGCVELIFNLADPFKRYHANGTTEIQPKTLITGQMRRYAMIEPTGRVKLLGVRFQPSGAYP